MKLNMRFFSILTAAALLAACSTSDSETLKRARTIQDETLKGISSLDSTLSAKLHTFRKTEFCIFRNVCIIN